jgi:hypothetical protein
MKMDSLRAVVDRIHHVHAMVERFAAASDAREAESLSMPLKRELGRFKRDLTSKGFGIMAQRAGELQGLAGRQGSQRQKTRRLREGVASLRSLADLEKRRILPSKRPDPAPDAPETPASEPSQA